MNNNQSVIRGTNNSEFVGFQAYLKGKIMGGPGVKEVYTRCKSDHNANLPSIIVAKPDSLSACQPVGKHSFCS